MSEKRVADMYALYQRGNSLSQVGKAYGITRQSVYGLFKKRGLAMRSKYYQPHIVFNGNKYTLNNNAYYRRTDGDRELLHRDMWKFHYGAIPMGFDIHHKDENKSNNELSNFECLPTPEHTRLHNPLRSIPTRYCLNCGKQLVRKVRLSGELETPSALGRRTYCNWGCRGQHITGKPKGWKP